MNRGRTLRTAPWRRAPWLLAKQPVVVVAIALSAAVLAVAASSAPLFLSTIGTASLQTAAAQRCPQQAMPSVGLAAQPYSGYDVQRNAAVTRLAARTYTAHGLPAPVNIVWGATRMSARTPGGPIADLPAYVFSAPHMLDHVTKLSAAGGHGVWINDQVARQTGLRAGMSLRLNGQTARIAGVYKALADPLNPTLRLPRFWCSWDAEIVPSVLANVPPTFVLADDLNYAVRASVTVHSTWYSPVDLSGLTLVRATALARAGEAAGHSVAVHRNTELLLPDHNFGMMTARAHHVQLGLSGAVVPIAAGGVVIAMLLVVGAGWFWALRRRGEIDMLVSRGIGPSALGAKAVLETLPWIVGGGAAGLGLTVLLVRQLGPAAFLEGRAVAQASGLIGAVVAFAALVIATIGASTGREVAVRHHARLRRLRVVPWELALLGAALAVYLSAHGKGITVDDQATVQLGPAALAFPLLGFAGALLLITRVLRQGMPRLRRIADRSRMPTFLAFTRIASSPAVALGVLIGIALPCGMLVYASGLQKSLGSSVQAKYETNLGAPHVLSTVSTTAGTTLHLGGTGTQVSVVSQAPVANDGEPVRLLGIDPATFNEFAYSHGETRSQVAQLTKARTDGRTTAIVVNLDGAGPISSVDIQGVKIGLHVIATRAAFPGLRDPYQPMVVMNRKALSVLPPHVGERAEQVWTTDASKPAASAALERHHIQVLYELSPQVLVGTTGLLPVTWVLSYLRALALLIGLVALAGLVFALAARAKRSAVAYILTRRMGVRRRIHLAALVIELGLIVGMGYVMGTALAEGGVGVVYRLLDTYPQYPPVPSFVFDGVIVAALAVAAVLVVGAAAAFAQLLADRARPADTMRAL